MANRPSSIDRLPKALKELIGAKRQEGCTLDEILDCLGQLQAGVSRSALGRHVQKLDTIGARMRETQDIAEALTTRLGDDPDDKLPRLNAQLMHGLLFQTLTALQTADEGNGPDGQVVLDSKDLKQFAEAARSLATAQATDAARIVKIRDVAKREAAAAAGKAAKGQGLGQETVDSIMRAIMGAEAA
jgi:hypothetical protein